MHVINAILFYSTFSPMLLRFTTFQDQGFSKREMVNQPQRVVDPGFHEQDALIFKSTQNLGFSGLSDSLNLSYI